ncbi:Beta-carotene isomerase D27, chloroplastic, partial [Linum grandiflorum]
FFFFFFFRFFFTCFHCLKKQEVGWDSEKPGYDGLIEVANRLMLIGRSSSYTRDAAVRILVSLFPPFLLELYKLLISPLAGGQIAAVMVARVTQLSCQWLMGKCSVNTVDLPDGTSWQSGVFVERCKYLEESKCVGICINTCKLPTQTFFKDYMGVPLLMEPNFTDYSCQVSSSSSSYLCCCLADLVLGELIPNCCFSSSLEWRRRGQKMMLQ